MSEFTVATVLVDILTFAESPIYLNKVLWPSQREILAAFFDEGKSLEELILVCGRRSSKTFIVSIIAAYLCYLWIETPDPYYLFQGLINRGEEVCFLCVAGAESQAAVLLGKIRNNIENSPYFRDRIEKNIMTEIQLPKNISITAIPSSSCTQVGKTALAVFFDEIGRYQEMRGARDGKEVYDALTPSVAQFVAARPAMLEKYRADPGLCRVIRLIGKIIAFSTPRAESGIFWELFTRAPNFPGTTIRFQRPTWEMNPNLPFACAYIQEQLKKDPAMFWCEFGAQFMKAGLNPAFNPADIDACISTRGSVAESPRAYVSCLDTSKSKDAFAFAIGHLLAGRVIIDYLKYWRSNGKRHNWDRVEQEIRAICRWYHVDEMYHDGYESEGVRLHFNGFNLHETPFTQKFKMAIYDNLENLMINRLIEFPGPVTDGRPNEDGAQFISELKALQREWNGDKYTIHHPDFGPVQNDDGPDVVANLSCHIYHKFVNTREGLEDMDERNHSREWPNDGRRDDGGTNAVTMIAGGQEHTPVEGDF